MEDEIDLRAYIKILLSRWYWIAGLALVAAIAAFAVSSLLPRTYVAKARLVMQRVHTEVVFVSSIRTQEQSALRLADLELRQDALRELAESAAVAAVVYDQLEARLDGVAAGVGVLRDMVKVTSKADLVIITARAGDPQIAADIANEWARQAEKQINAAYGQPLQETQRLEMQAQSEKAQAQYETLQAELEAFLAQSRIPELEREIARHEQFIAEYQRALIDSEAAMHTLALDSSRQILLNLYDELVSTEQVLIDARTLAQEIRHVPGSPAAEWARALAFIDLEDRAFGGRRTFFEVVLSGEAPAVDGADLDRLIENLEEKRQELGASIRQKERELFDVEPITAAVDPENPLVRQIQALTQEMLSLQSQLEAEQARERELSEARDLAWETHRAVTRKIAETEVETQVSDMEVRFATPAKRPGNPVSSNRLRNAAIAGALGLMMGVLAALGVEYWQQGTPELSVSAKQASEQTSTG
ncbi:MAG: Wzz/FepE/Etk N-terminal domain-containing protein [Planctomycetota bacterium]|jgi:capsular polysaccharide biosynthesis protein